MSATVSTHTPAPAITVEALLTVLRAASPEEMAALLAELNRGMPLWDAAKKEAPTARGKMAARAAQAAALLPEAADGEAPLASAYRVAAADIDLTVCVGRRLADSTKDTRWKPAVYREFQCGKPQAGEECDLCTTCRERKDRYDANPKPGDWVGRITEEPLGWVHMLGTEWATGPKAPKWLGGEDAGSDAASVASGGSGATEQMSAPAAVITQTQSAPAAAAPMSKAEIALAKAQAKAEEAAAKAAAKAEEAAKKAAEKAEAAAAKAAEKAEAAAAKAAEKAAAAAAKEAEKVAAAAAKAKAKEEAAAAKAAAKAKPAKPAATTVSAPVAAKAAPAADAEEVDEDEQVTMIGGEMYVLKGNKAYAFISATETAGDFVGTISADGKSIEVDAD
jgi:chemotaxis protein histidine kinase CheA